MIAGMCKEIFGDQLYLLPLNYDHFEHFKSPEQLRNKVVVKSKSNIFDVKVFADKDHMVNNYNILPSQLENLDVQRQKLDSYSYITSQENIQSKEEVKSKSRFIDPAISHRTIFEEHPLPHGDFGCSEV